MPTHTDWLTGGDRAALAVERIHAAAGDLIARHGMAGLSIDQVAARAGCSRATVYRHVGGKAALRDAVLAGATARIAAGIATAVADLTGAERITGAITAALAAVRADRVATAFLDAAAPREIDRFLASDPRLADAAADLTGARDPQAGRWIVRVVLSMLFWPAGDAAAERAAIERFVLPAFR